VRKKCLGVSNWSIDSLDSQDPNNMTVCNAEKFDLENSCNNYKVISFPCDNYYNNNSNIFNYALMFCSPFIFVID
jgi:hypothetical protein